MNITVNVVSPLLESSGSTMAGWWWLIEVKMEILSDPLWLTEQENHSAKFLPYIIISLGQSSPEESKSSLTDRDTISSLHYSKDY